MSSRNEGQTSSMSLSIVQTYLDGNTPTRTSATAATLFCIRPLRGSISPLRLLSAVSLAGSFRNRDPRRQAATTMSDQNDFDINLQEIEWVDLTLIGRA